jgi:dipeptidyl aminopeptidase/acylaminoacyl peptidase
LVVHRNALFATDEPLAALARQRLRCVVRDTQISTQHYEVVMSASTALQEAQLPTLIPRNVLFGNPERTSPQLSPDGKYLAYLAPDEKDVLQVWLRTVGQQDDRILTADKKRGILFYFWTFNGDQLIYLQDADGDENFHFYSVNIKSNIVRDLTPFQGVKAELVDCDPQLPRSDTGGVKFGRS